MLDADYSSRFDQVVAGVKYEIVLPDEWKSFFRIKGASPSCLNDQRSAGRHRVRTRGVLYFESGPAFCRRSPEPLGIYTNDFSRQGIGIIAPLQIMPEEVVRLLVVTFWARVRVVRTRRLGPHCYDVGCELIRQYAPGGDAFESPVAADGPPQ